MIAEEKKQAVLAAIERMEDEAAFEKIAAVVAEVSAPLTPHGQAGFMKGTVRYLVDDWDAPLSDTNWNFNQ